MSERPKCTKFDFGWGSARDRLTGGPYSALPAPGLLVGGQRACCPPHRETSTAFDPLGIDPAVLMHFSFPTLACLRESLPYHEELLFSCFLLLQLLNFVAPLVCFCCSRRSTPYLTHLVQARSLQYIDLKLSLIWKKQKKYQGQGQNINVCNSTPKTTRVQIIFIVGFSGLFRLASCILQQHLAMGHSDYQI